jgi:hypothetical protein
MCACGWTSNKVFKFIYGLLKMSFDNFIMLAVEQIEWKGNILFLYLEGTVFMSVLGHWFCW